MRADYFAEILQERLRSLSNLLAIHKGDHKKKDLVNLVNKTFELNQKIYATLIHRDLENYHVILNAVKDH